MFFNKKIKNTLIIFIVFLIILTQAIPAVRAAQSPFIDIIGHWGEEYINNTYSKGIVNGYPGNIFEPDGSITRAEMAVIIIKALGMTPVNKPQLKFNDTYSIGGWAAGYIAAAVDNGIITGYPDGTYLPDNKINRSEIAVMVMRALRITNPSDKQTIFKDDGSIPSWARAYIAKAYDMGILTGVQSGNDYYFFPNNDTTRAEACVIIDKIAISNDIIAPTVPGKLKFTDTTASTITLSWSASNDIMGVKGYRVYRNGTALADTDGSTYTYTDTDVAFGNTYVYTIAAFDESNNFSPVSAELKINYDAQIPLYDINTGKSITVSIDKANDFPGYARESDEIYIFNGTDGHQSTCNAENLETLLSQNWYTAGAQLTMYDLNNNPQWVYGSDIYSYLRQGWTFIKLTDIQQLWRIPYHPEMFGDSDFDRTITNYVLKINSKFVPSAAASYYSAAVNQGCLPDKYKVSPPNDSQSIDLIVQDLKWDQQKLDRLWEETAKMSDKYGSVIDPRLLFSVILQEGTGSFDTNVSPHSPRDGGGYIQPDFEADLAKAFNNHILGKIWAYSNYADAFETTSQASQGRQFTIRDKSGAKVVITYRGKGDLFEYTNNDVPRIKWSDSANAYIVSYGVYATDYNWCDNLRSIYESVSGSGTATGYSDFLRSKPVPWPSGLEMPSGSFVMTNQGTDWTGQIGGYPMINFVSN